MIVAVIKLKNLMESSVLEISLHPLHDAEKFVESVLFSLVNHHDWNPKSLVKDSKYGGNISKVLPNILKIATIIIIIDTKTNELLYDYFINDENIPPKEGIYKNFMLLPPDKVATDLNSKVMNLSIGVR